MSSGSTGNSSARYRHTTHGNTACVFLGKNPHHCILGLHRLKERTIRPRSSSSIPHRVAEIADIHLRVRPR